MRILVLTSSQKNWEGFSVLGHNADVVEAWLDSIERKTHVIYSLRSERVSALDYDLFVITELSDQKNKSGIEVIAAIYQRVDKGGKLVVFADGYKIGGVRYPNNLHKLEHPGREILLKTRKNNDRIG